MESNQVMGAPWENYQPTATPLTGPWAQYSQQAEEPAATPSPFGSNRGVTPPNSNSPDDFNKSMVAGAEQTPMWLGDMANAETQAITKGAAATYTTPSNFGSNHGIAPYQGNTLTEVQKNALDNPTLPFEGSQQVYKDAGMPLYDPKTSLGIFGKLLGNAGGMGVIGEAAPLVDAAAGKAADAAMSVPEGVGLRARGALAKDTDFRNSQSEQFSNDTSQKYQDFDATGARLTDNSANALNDAVRKSYADIKIDPAASPKTVSALKNIYQRVTQGKIDPVTGEVTQEPLSVGEVDQYRRQLARASYGEDTAAASAARNAIDNHLNNLTDNDFVGGDSDNAVNKLTAARQAAAKEFKFNDLLDIQNKAAGDPNKIKKLMGKYLDQNSAGLSDDEISTLKRASERSPVEALERGLGTFGFDLGHAKNVALPALVGENALQGATAFMPHGAPLVAAGTAARQTAKWAGRGALEDAINAIAKRDTSVKPPAPTEPAMPPKPMLALPAPKTINYTNSSGQTVPLSEAGRESIGQSPSTAAEKIPAENAASNDLIAQNPSKMIKQIGNKRILDNPEGSVPVPAAIASGGAALAAQQALKPSDISTGMQNNKPVNPIEKPQSSLPDVQSFVKPESGGNPNAKNPNSSASGLYQFTNKTWNDMVARYGKQTGINLGDKNNPQAQATMASLYAKDNIPVLQKSLGRMPTIGELYAAHVLGPTGASRLFAANPNSEAIMSFPRQVFDANHNLFFNGKIPRTVGEVRNLLTQKVQA